jgi:hypothetical protein
MVDDKVTFDNSKNKTIDQQAATFGVLVTKIIDFLGKPLNDLVDATTLRARIEATFTNLKTQSSKGFLQFKPSESDKSSSWEYRLLLSFDPHPDKSKANRFYSLVTTIEIGAAFTEKSDWWNLTADTKGEFSAHLKSIELVIKDDFKAPATNV